MFIKETVSRIFFLYITSVMGAYQFEFAKKFEIFDTGRHVVHEACGVIDTAGKVKLFELL
jgi:hypothetical protein